MFVFGLAVIFKLVNIQFLQGDKYRAMVEQTDIKNMTIPANRGNVYASDGSLLATSIPKYDIAIDPVVSSTDLFEMNIKGLCDSLSNYSGKASKYFERKIRKARVNKNQFVLLERNLSYSDYIRFRNFPLLNRGAIPGGLIVQQTTKREYPMGGMARRTIGYEREDEDGNITRPGIDGAFGVKYLSGTNGKRWMQKIGPNKWKPLTDYNQVEPQDGYDVYTTIDVNIQDIAHHALLEQLDKYKADHGCVVVMETKTGEIKAISNLGRNSNGLYYERLNYAVGESQEPGSTFKTMALMAALEDKIVDTSTVIDTKLGYKTFYGRAVYDTHGHGKISAARVLEVSSNVGIATIIDDGYSKNPEKFIDHLKEWHLNKPLGLPIIGEGDPIIPEPGDKIWSKNALPSMAYGYNLKLTPLQILTFYNAIANNGIMVKPRFIKKVKELNDEIATIDKEIINKKICSDKTLKEMQTILKHVVDRGTGTSLYSKHFSMAGKTGTARTEYWMKDWNENKRYISSFTGYFPAENPKYSCIVVIYKPSVEKGYYGADVTGPVFNRIAQKIFIDTPNIDEVESLDVKTARADEQYEQYFNIAKTYKTIMPDLVGLPAMDALALLENMDVQVRVDLQGGGVITAQSVSANQKLKNNQTVVLKAS
ncbi:penicillin-binding protein [Gaetbulibacter sp. M240]|uniref:penicillin-binding protein n=1 Tax=Gaetbulibacter sp. M240 TaxID=3126511 RepID=UPI00374F2DD8